VTGAAHGGDRNDTATGVLVIACGAIARELVRIRDLNGWRHVEFQCLPPELHNRPEHIPQAIKENIEAAASNYGKVFVAYADCGTGGKLDRVLEAYGIERIPGAHCYEFYSGAEQFRQLAEEEPGSFYLTDFLTRHFDRLGIRGLGIDRLPQLIPSYFGNYKRLVYLAQTDSEELQTRARRHASFLGLEYVFRHVGDQPLTLELTPHLGL
jgi:hypothetical protein